MKYQLIFWTLFGISLGIDFWGYRQSHSAPAPVFRPINTVGSNCQMSFNHSNLIYPSNN